VPSIYGVLSRKDRQRAVVAVAGRDKPESVDLALGARSSEAEAKS
jgi:hypothetical protein